MGIFIRVGWWCECGKSWRPDAFALLSVPPDPNRGQWEAGISVFECTNRQFNGSDCWFPDGDALEKNCRSVKPITFYGWYGSIVLLVEGNTIGTLGGDREPLLRPEKIQLLAGLEPVYDTDGYVLKKTPIPPKFPFRFHKRIWGCPFGTP